MGGMRGSGGIEMGLENHAVVGVEVGVVYAGVDVVQEGEAEDAPHPETLIVIIRM